MIGLPQNEPTIKRILTYVIKYGIMGHRKTYEKCSMERRYEYKEISNDFNQYY